VAQVTAMGWSVPADSQLALGRALRREYHVRTLTACTTCHR
jgi:hypothetical protein